MDRKHLLSCNYSLFKKQAQIISSACDAKTRILVVGNPSNTNALAIKNGLNNIPSTNVTSLSRLDENRAVGTLAKKLGVSNSQIFNVGIFGNHSKTMFTDVSQAFWVESDFLKVNGPVFQYSDIPEGKFFIIK